jgi:hypothetical protein
VNLYAMVGNDAVNFFDIDGRALMSGGFPSPFPPYIPPGGYGGGPSIPEFAINPVNK